MPKEFHKIEILVKCEEDDADLLADDIQEILRYLETSTYRVFVDGTQVYAHNSGEVSMMDISRAYPQVENTETERAKLDINSLYGKHTKETE